MVVVEHLAGFLDVQVVRGVLVPGQGRQPVEEGGRHRVLRRGGVHARKPLQLALGLAGGLGRQVLLLDLGAVLIDLDRALVLVPELGLDGFELLAQVVFALFLVHVPLDLVLDFLAQIEDLELLVDDAGDLLQPLADREDLQHLLLFLRGGVERGGDHVRQGPRLLDGLGHVDDLGRQGRGMLDDPREQVHDVGHEGLDFRVARGVFGQMFYRSLPERLAFGLRELLDAKTPQALDQQLRAVVGRLGHFEDHGAGADRRVVAWCRRAVGCLIRFGEHHAHDPVPRHGLVDELHRVRGHDEQREHHLGKQHAVGDRQDGQGFGYRGRGRLLRRFFVRHPYLQI